MNYQTDIIKQLMQRINGVEWQITGYGWNNLDVKTGQHDFWLKVSADGFELFPISFLDVPGVSFKSFSIWEFQADSRDADHCDGKTHYMLFCSYQACPTHLFSNNNVKVSA